MTSVDTMAGILADEEDEFATYAKGRVQAIDQTWELWKLQIKGRWMPYVDETIDVGDLVLWDDDFQDPFAWVREEEAGNFSGQWRPYGETVLAGEWTPRYDDRDDQGIIGAPFGIAGTAGPGIVGPTRIEPMFAEDIFGTRFWNKGIVFYQFQRNPGYDGDVVEAEDAISPHGHEGGNPNAIPVNPPYEDPGDPIYHWLDDEGFSFAHFDSVIGDGNLGGGQWHVDGYTYTVTGGFPTVVTYSVRHWIQSRLVFPNCVGIRQMELTDTFMMGNGDVHSFPAVNAPGKDWLVVFILFIRPHSLDDYDTNYSETLEYEYDIDDHSFHVGQSATQQVLSSGVHLVYSGTTKRAGVMSPTISLEGTPRAARLASFVFETDLT